MVGRDVCLLPPSAKELFHGSLVKSTWQGLGGKFRLFAAFCASLPDRPSPLPCSEVTVARYVTHLYDKGSVAGISLQQYIWPIFRLHSDLRLPTPDGPLLSSLRAGFRKLRVSAPRPRSNRPRRVPLPAFALGLILQAGRRALASSEFRLARSCAAVVFSALWFARAGTTVPTTGRAVAFSGGGVRFTEPHFKGRGTERPRTLTVRPTGWNAELVDFLRRFWSLQSADGTVFGALNGQSESALLTSHLLHALAACHLSPPDGSTYTSHSLRAAAATASLAIRVPLPRILAFGGWKSVNSVMRYIDPLARPCDAAYIFFGHLL